MTRGTMKDDGLSDEEARNLKARATRIEDYQDSIAESSGLDRGKRLRFLSEDQTPKGREVRRQERGRFQTFTLTMQQRLQFQTRIDELDRASLEALREAERRVEQAQKHLDEIQNAATVDDRGRRVYRTQDGTRGYYEDETQVPDAEFAKIKWRPNDPKWEQFRAQGQETSEAVEQRDEIRDYRERLVQTRNRLDRGEELNADEIAALQDGNESMPTAVAARLDAAQHSRTSAAREHMSDKTFANAPDVNQSFNQAGSGEPVTQQTRNDRAPAPRPPQP